jgi:hypothetical protein
VSALAKEVGCETGKLPGLFCENQLVISRAAVTTTTVDGTMLADAALARSTLEAYTMDADEVTGDSICKLIALKGPMLHSIDKHFKIEAAFFDHLCGPEGAKRFTVAILKCLPTASKPVTWMDSLTQLTTLAESKLNLFCGRGLANQLDIIRTWVMTGSKHRSPKMDGISGDLMVKVKTRFQFFFVERSSRSRRIAW